MGNGQRVPSYVFDLLLEFSDRLIFEVELLATSVAMDTWGKVLAEFFVIFFVTTKPPKAL